MSLIQRAAHLVAAILTTTGLLATAPALAEDAPATRASAFAATATTPLPLPPVAVLTDTKPASSPRTAFASLAEAVAAQYGEIDRGLIEGEHLRCLASAVYFESQGEPLAGQLGVARVIMNRIRSGRFASNVCGVILQRGQFGFVRGGAIPAIDEARPAYRTAVAVAKVAMSEAWTASAASEALYFNGVRARRVGGQRVAVIGGHAFYR